MSASLLDYSAPADVAIPVTSTGGKRPLSVWLQRSLIVLFTAIVSYLAFGSGIQMRQWFWNSTADCHYRSDMENRWKWATFANDVGLYNTYDVIEITAMSDGYHQGPDYGLDYAPLRLWLMSSWEKWVHEKYPYAGATDVRYEVSAPLLQFNYAVELWGALGVFLLVRNWMRQSYRADLYPPRSRIMRWYRRLLRKAEPSTPVLPLTHPATDDFFYGWWHALIAALIFWFNPALMASAHGWPTWDMWVIPFFIWSVYFAQSGHFFFSGIVLGVGALMKGQLLFVIPMFILWPLIQLRIGAAFAWIGGMLTSLSVIVAPWMLTYRTDLASKLRGMNLGTLVANPTLAAARVKGDRLLNTDAIHWIIALGLVAILANLFWMVRGSRKSATNTLGNNPLSPIHSLATPLAFAQIAPPSATAAPSATGLSDINPDALFPDEPSPAASDVMDDALANRQGPVHRVFSVLRQRILGVPVWVLFSRLCIAILAVLCLNALLKMPGQNPSGKLPLDSMIANVQDLVANKPAPTATFGRNQPPRQPARGSQAARAQLQSDLLQLKSGPSTWVIMVPWLPLVLPTLLILVAWPLRWRGRLIMLFTILGAAAMSSIYLLNASNAWASIGWFFGLRHYPNMTTGTANNLAAILSNNFGWRDPSVEFTFVKGDYFGWPEKSFRMSIGEILRILTTVLLVISCIGVAIQHKRKDPRFLIAVCTPWMIFFTFPTQVHERYLIFCAASAAIWVGAGWGMTLLGLFLTAHTFIMTMQIMLGQQPNPVGTNISTFGSEIAPDFSRWLLNIADRLHPNAGYSSIVIALLMLYLCFAPSRRRQKPHRWLS